MKPYYYLLFRIYSLYKDKYKESDTVALFSTIAVSTTILFINITTIYSLTNYFGFIPIITNKIVIVFCIVSIGLINYFSFVRGRKFMNYGFQKDKKGGVLIVTISNLNVMHFSKTLNIFKEKK